MAPALPYDVLFYHQALDAHPLRAAQSADETAIDGDAMAATALRVAARRAPLARPGIATDRPDAFAGIAGIAVERHALDDPRQLALDRMRWQRAAIAARIGRADRGGIVFLDTDALVLRDLAPLFGRPFDVALTCIEASLAGPAPALDRWGLPTDGRPSAINFGVSAARATPAAVAFFDAVLARYEEMIAAGPAFLNDRRNVFRAARQGTFRVDDIRTWGGGQFALVSLLSGHLFGTLRPEATVAGAHVLLLPADRWNFSPPADRAISRGTLEGRFVLHLKGARKTQFAAVADWLL